MGRVLRGVAVVLVVGLAGADKPADGVKPNPNTLVKQHKDKLKLEASSTWPTWPVEKAFDGNPQTSWFSAAKDIGDPKKRTGPWVTVTFPEDVTVTRLTVLGNREPPWPGYQVVVAVVEFLDKDGKAVRTEELEAQGLEKDIDFTPGKPIPGVRAIKITSISDEGEKNPYTDIGIAEIQVS